MNRKIIVIALLILLLGWPGQLAYGRLLDETTSPAPLAAEIESLGATALAGAIDIDPGTLLQASLGASDNLGAGVADSPLSFFPRQGGTFAILSTGLAASADDPDTNNAEIPQGQGHLDDVSFELVGLNNSDGQDLAQLSLILKPPANATSLSFDFAFYSEEFPDWIGFAFNDVFVAELAAEPFTSQLQVDGADISAPANIAFDPNGDFLSVNAAFGFNPQEPNPDTDTTYDGTSGLLRATGCLPEVRPTGNVVLILSITDVGDSILDSAVFLDNFQWGNPEQCSSGAEQVNIELTPETAVKLVTTDHAVTATVLDDLGQPQANQLVGFKVAGANSVAGQAMTNSAGLATFQYTGQAVGQDTITAWLDDGDLTQESGEPFDTATVIWQEEPTPTPNSISITKEAPGASEAERFGFTGDLADFTLGAGETILFDELSPGDYRIIESQLPKRWILLSVLCNGQSLPVQDFTDPPGRGVTLSLEEGQAFECVFHNERTTYEEEARLYLPLIWK